VNGRLQPVQAAEEEALPTHPSLPVEHHHDSSSDDSSYSSSESSEEDDDDDEENVFAWMAKTKKVRKRKVPVAVGGNKQLATGPSRRSDAVTAEGDDAMTKRTNRSGVITPCTTEQKRRGRISSATILSSSSVTKKRKKVVKKARRDDDDDNDDDYDDDDDEAKREEEETVHPAKNRAVWTPELVRTYCSTRD